MASDKLSRSASERIFSVVIAETVAVTRTQMAYAQQPLHLARSNAPRTAAGHAPLRAAAADVSEGLQKTL